MAVVGSAEIVVRAITSKVKTDIEAAFKDVARSMNTEGENAAKNFAKSFGDTLDKRLAPEMQRAVHNATSSAERDLTRDLSEAGRNASRAAGNEIENELGNAGGRGGSRAGQNFASTFGKEFSGSLSRLLNLASTLDIMGPAIANLAAGLSSLVSGLFAVASAASQAAGALAVLPGLLSVLLQAGGALKLAFGGVGNALKLGAKAQLAAGNAASTAGSKVAKAATGSAKLAKANQALTDATKALAEAQKELNQARKEAAGFDADQAAAEKLLNATKINLDSVLGAAGATAGDGAEAQKAFDDAGKAAELLALRKENANKKVTEAEDRVAKAQANVDKATKARNAAQKGAGAGAAALTPAAKAADLYQAALARLSPAARAFVEEIIKMKKAFKEVGDTVAGKFFPPVTQALKLIGSSRFFPILKQELGQTGGLLGKVALDFGRTFTAPRSMSRFQRILEGNNKIITVLSTSMKDLGGRTGDTATPVQHLLNLLEKVLIAIQPITRRFVIWAANLVATADGMAKVGRNGKGMTGFLERAGDRAAQLGRIFRNLFLILGDLGKAAIPAGDGLLKSFEKATNKLHQFLKTPEQQKTLKKFFDDTATNVRAISHLLSDIGKVFLGLGDNKGVKSFADSLDTAVLKFGKLADKLTSKEVGKASGDLFGGIADLLNQLTQSGQMEVFLKTLTGIVKVITILAKGFNSLPGPVTAFLLGAVAINRAFTFSAKLLGFSKSFTQFKQLIIRGIGSIVAKVPGLGKLGDKLKKVGLPKANTAGGTGDARAQGQSVGHAIADGIAEGIGEHSALVIEAVDKMVAELIAAVKARLDSHSPSRVMAREGGNAAEGFVLGIKEDTALAFKAGEDLAQAATDGARAGSAGAVGAGKAKGKVAAVAGAASSPVTSALADDLGNIGGTAEKTGGKFAKLGGTTGKLTGLFKGLGGGLMALTGGPFGLFLIALPLIITAFTKLYKNSPAFRKFVDGIVNAVKPLIKWIGEHLLKALNAFFNWVNENLPKLGKFFSESFHVIGAAVGWVVDFIKKHWPLIVGILLGPFAFVVAEIIKHWSSVKGAFQAGLGVARRVFSAIGSRIGAMKDRIGTAIGGVKDFFGGFKKALGEVRDKVREIVDRIKTIFTDMKTSVGGAFNGLKDLIKTPLNNIIGFINDKFIKNINTITKKFGLTIPTIPGFAEGGWTGPGPKNKVAGVVHADEFVVTKAARQQIERSAPGALETMNRTGSIPGRFVPLGDIGDIAGGLISKGKSAVNSVENLAKRGVGKVLTEVVGAAIGGLGKAGIHKGLFINDLFIGIMEKLKDAAGSWGQSHQKQADQKAGKAGGGGADVGVSDPSNPRGISLWRGGTFTNRFIAHLKTAEQLAKATMYVFQGGFRPPTSYSGTSHAGDAIDIKVNYALLYALRRVGIAAGDRTGLGNWAPHIHAVPSPSAGYGAGSALWQWQDYVRRGGAKQGPRSAWGLAAGGIALARPGGVHAVIAEGGRNERVEPLDHKGLSKRDKEIMKQFGSGQGLTVNVHNPEPERASQSVSRAIRDKAFQAGWRN